MLAPNDDLKPIPFAEVIEHQEVTLANYSGFPVWLAMLVEPSREVRSAEWLKRVHVHVYLPIYSKVIRRRGAISGRRGYAILPGMLFVPAEFMDIDRRDEVLQWAHVRGFVRTAGGIAQISKANIEIIREIEAKLNTEEAGGIPDAAGNPVAVGRRVQFLNEVYSAFFGDGVVVEVASTTRIGVEVVQLFGCSRKVYVPASEIEVI